MDIPVLATIALFLYHGANPWFWIVTEPGKSFEFWFETGSNKSSSRSFSGWGDHWKRNKASVSKEYSEFWDRHRYRLSLRELLALWFPKYSQGLQKVVDWLGEQEMEKELSAEKRRELQNTFGHFLRPLFEGSVLEGLHDRGRIKFGPNAPWQPFGSMVPGTTTYICID